MNLFVVNNHMHTILIKPRVTLTIDAWVAKCPCSLDSRKDNTHRNIQRTNKKLMLIKLKCLKKL